MNAFDFKEYVDSSVNNLAELYGVEDLEKYYELTDYQFPQISNLSGVEQAFAQFAFHAQNRQRLDQIVKFMQNFNFIKSVLEDFKPSDFLSKYGYKYDEFSIDNCSEAVDKLVQAFRKGLTWSRENSTKPDFLMKSYAIALIHGAVYFKKFNTKKEIIDDLKAHFVDDNHRKLIKYALKQFRPGISVALCYDFLKELDDSFDLGKPDTHLKDVIAKYKQYDNNPYKKGSDEASYRCIDDFMELVREIKKRDRTMTAYKLDRQIWLCCSGNFFLDNIDDIKDLFIKKIQ